MTPELFEKKREELVCLLCERSDVYVKAGEKLTHGESAVIAGRVLNVFNAYKMMSRVGLERACNVCGRSLPMEDFHRDKTQAGGRRLACGSCSVKAAKRSRARKGKHPLTLEQKQKRRGIKLNRYSVTVIRRHIREGYTQKQISNTFDVSPSLIGRIHRREIWKNASHDDIS